MSIKPGELYGLDDKALLERAGGAQVGSPMVDAILQEFQRRSFVAQREAADAAKAAADAAKETARWTKVSAIAIALSVVAIAVGIWLKP